MSFTNIQVKDTEAVWFAEEASLASFMPPVEGEWIDRLLLGRAENALRNAIVKCMDEGLGRYKAKTYFSETLHPIVGRGEPFYEMLVNTAKTRARVFSRIHGCQKAGIEAYEISIVSDDRTPKVAELMDGKVFEVSDAATVANDLLGLESASEVSSVARWLSPEEIQKRSDEQLVQAGFIIPPFHDGCRSRLQAI